VRNRLTATLVAAVLVVGACQGSTTSPTATPGPPSAPPPSAAPATATAAPTPVDYDQLLYGASYAPSAGTQGGKVIISNWQAADQLNPYFSNAFGDFEVLAGTMRTLLVVTSDGRYLPDLAAGPITYSDSVKEDTDGKGGFTVHIAIKPNLKWSDGVSFTLNDMAYTWKAVLDPGQVGITTLSWEEVDRIDVSPDGLHAELHFKEPFAGWLGVVGGSFILPEHYMKTIPIKDWAAKSYPVSPALASAPTIGPFKYVTATADTIELARDDNWAGPAQACNGRPCLDQVTFKSYADKGAEIAAFLAGETEVTLGLAQTDYDAIKNVDPAVGQASLQPAWVYEHLDFNLGGFGQGQGHPALKDLVVRRAIEQALDKRALWETVFPGSPYPDDNPCTNATPTNYWQLPNATCPSFDVAAANAALDAAGYARGADGIRVDPKSKLPLVLENCTMTTGFRELAADFLAKSLQAIGIKLNESFVDGSTVLFAGWSDIKADTKCNLAHGTYDLAEFAYIISLDLYGNYYYSYHSEQIPTSDNKGNGYNYVRLADPTMDAAIVALKQAIRPADQVQATYRIQRQYIAQIPEVVLYYRNEARGVSVKLQNFLKNPSTSSDMWNIQDWWLRP
jgi:peptide/nickel transport system substrate-binding protein